VLLQLGQAVSSAPTAAALRQAVPVAHVAGLFRDLRGIASATATRRTYGFMFEWLYPQHMPTVLKCLEVRRCEVSATLPVLTAPPRPVVLPATSARLPSRLPLESGTEGCDPGWPRQAFRSGQPLCVVCAFVVSSLESPQPAVC
jgi:hypothetical protein